VSDFASGEIFANHQDYRACQRAVDYCPIHFGGIGIKAELRAVYDLGIPGLYRLSIVYGAIALNGMVCVYDPDLCVYFDYSSMLFIMQTLLGRHKHSE
jgi:hypothetical protein